MLPCCAYDTPYHVWRVAWSPGMTGKESRDGDKAGCWQAQIQAA
jgi:hypothetical protein